MPQLHEDSVNFILAYDGGAPHWLLEVKVCPDEHLPRLPDDGSVGPVRRTLCSSRDLLVLQN